MDALKGKTAIQARREQLRSQSARFSPVTEFVKEPQLFDVYDPAYDWLTDPQRRHLDEDFEFSYYDILQCAAGFLSLRQACELLMTTEKRMDEYVQTLFRKPIRMIYDALLSANKHAAISEIILPWAQKGSSTAISILTHGVMRLDEDSGVKELKVKIVNDLDSDDEPEEPEDQEDPEDPDGDE